MKCYKCGSFLYDGEYCSNCGTDITVYREIVLKSNDFYNSALEFARDRNLSKAIEHLKLSLKLYKGNINAHNLLGLVYFETGEYTLGFAHWVISKNIQPENNLASKFLDQIQDDKVYFDSLNSNIRKYNKAIDYVRQGSYDLAEIQLKKLLNDDDVHMVNAHQLLALLRIRKKKYAAARKILAKAQAIDAGNPTTIAYTTFVNSQIKDEEKELTPGELKNKRQTEDAEDNLRTPLSGDDVIIPKSSYREYNPATMAVLQILLGFLVGAALIFFLVVPAKTNSVRKESESYSQELEERVAALTAENAQLLEEQANASASDSAAQTDNGDPQAAVNSDVSKDQEILLEAYQAYQNGDLEGAGTLLYDIKDPQAFDTANKVLYDSISFTKDSLPDFWFEDAMDLFEQNNFAEAGEKFKKVYDVANTTGESLYYLALCYYNQDDSENAGRYFREYIDTYPEGAHVDECYYLLSIM